MIKDPNDDVNKKLEPKNGNKTS